MWMLPVVTLLAMASAGEVRADLHLDTPTQLVRKGVGFDGEGLESGLGSMLEGGTNVAVEVLWPPRAGDWAAHVERMLTKVEAEDRRLDSVKLARTPSEARVIADTGRIALLLALEGAHGIDKTGLDGLRALHARGLSMLGLTWSFSNRYAGSSGDDGGGLTADGKALIAEASRLGVLLDVSHASRTTTLEVCRGATAPIVASHSNAAVVHPHARNLTDEEIRCIAETGGVIGVNFHSSFLGSPASAERAADHADHLRRIGGIGVGALGSDFDGIITPPRDLPDASRIPAFWAALRTRGWTEGEIGLAAGENFMRAWASARSIAGLDP